MNNFFDKSLKQLTILTLALLAVFIFAKTINTVIDISQKNKITNKASHKITFSGSAQVKAVPDIANFTITIREIDKNISAAQQKMAQKSTKLLNLFKKIGIDKKDIQTKHYNTNPKYSYISISCEKKNCKKKESVITGYEAMESISIKLRNLKKSADLLTQIANLDIAEVRGPIFKISDDSKFKIQAQKKAIKNAKSNAIRTAKNLGITLGKIISFSETPQYRQHYATMSLDRSESLSSSPHSPQIEAGEQIIFSKVSISYEIK